MVSLSQLGASQDAIRRAQEQARRQEEIARQNARTPTRGEVRTIAAYRPESETRTYSREAQEYNRRVQEELERRGTRSGSSKGSKYYIDPDQEVFRTTAQKMNEEKAKAGRQSAEALRMYSQRNPAPLADAEKTTFIQQLQNINNTSREVLTLAPGPIGDAARIQKALETKDFKSFAIDTAKGYAIGAAAAAIAAGVGAIGGVIAAKVGGAAAAAKVGGITLGGTTAGVISSSSFNVGSSAIMGSAVAGTISLKSLAVLGALTGTAGSLYGGLWAYAESAEPISVAMGKLYSRASYTKDPADWELYEEARKARDEILNLPLWEQIAKYTPLVGAVTGSMKKLEGVKRGAQLLDAMTENAKIQQQRNETEVERTRREQTQQTDMFTQNTNYYAQQQQETTQRIQELQQGNNDYLANREEWLKMELEYQKELSELERRDREEIAKFWLEYHQKKRELQIESNKYYSSSGANQSYGKSTLNFGLL